MKGKSHAREVKARAIAELIAGDSPTVIAAKYRLPRKSVSNWKAALTPDQLAEVGRNTRGRLDELVCDHLEAALNSLTDQAKAAGDPEYIRKQSAKDLATLHDIMFERAFSMLDRWKS